MRVTKSSKRVSPPHPEVIHLIDKLAETPTEELATFIATVTEWRWPRSDLGNWVKVLNKFDVVLRDVIRDYDLDKLQLNPFTPQTKATVLEVLRFEKMLLENSTGRKLYASYDRLNSLLFTSDLDVLVADLKVILRPSVQYSSQPPSAQTSNISSSRLTSLAQSWSILREQGIELHDYLDAKKAPIHVDLTSNESADVKFQFYRKAGDKALGADLGSTRLDTTSTAAAASGLPVSPTIGAASKAVPGGMTVVHLSGVATSTKDSMVLLAEAVEKYNIPEDERFELLCRIRVTKALAPGHEEEREKLLVARLLSIAIYAHTHSESSAMNTLFLYDPELVNHIGELVQPDRDIPYPVQVAALTVLDALGRYRFKISEVLSAVNAGVSHGTLLSSLRKTVALLQDSESSVPLEFVEALLSLFMLLTSSPGGGPAIVGAGLIPLIIQILDVKTPSRLTAVSKTTVLLDNVLYGYGNAFQVFCNNGGVDVLIGRIAAEVDLGIEAHKDDAETGSAAATYGRLPYARSSFLKHLMRSMHRMMQASGASEGLRTLIDSSLPKSVKKIMEYRVTFGPPIYSIAINLMSLFVHNEPSTLTVLQEMNLPSVFYDAVESGIEPALEVISALPNAIGALCLNTAGEAQLAARMRVIPSIFETFTSEAHLKVLGEKENAIVVGTALDELIRHHPSLKAQVFEGVLVMFQRIEDIGNTWTPPPGDESQYVISSPIGAGSLAAPTSVVDSLDEMDVVEDAPAAAPSANDPDAEAAEESKDDPSVKGDRNIVTDFIDVAAKILEGLFQYGPHCRDFVITYNGLERLGRLLSLPALPIRFSDSEAADSLLQIFRTMAELNTKETLSGLAKIVRSALDDTKNFWDTMDVESRMSQMITSASDDTLVNVNFRKVVTLAIAITVYSDTYQTLAYSHTRGTSTVLQVLNGTEAPDILTDIGKAHRAFCWEKVVLIHAQQTEKADVKEMPSGLTDEQGSSTALASDAGGATQAAGEDLSKLINQDSSMGDGKSDGRSDVVKYLVDHITWSLTPFFQAIAKLVIPSRRGTTDATRALCSAVALRIARILSEHCKWKGSPNVKSTFAYNSLVVNLITALLRDERTPAQSFHTLLLVTFKRLGGLDAVVSFGEGAAAYVDSTTSTPFEERSLRTNAELGYSYGLIDIVVHLLGLLVDARPLLESTHTPLLVTRDKDVRDPAFFEPHDFLVQMRLTTLPFLRRLWESTWLPKAPLPALKSILCAMVEIMAAEHEENKGPNAAEPSNPSVQALHAHLRQAQVPDEAAITQLVDMGFSRSSAEQALARTRNNVNAAADLLLSHPHLFPNLPQPRMLQGVVEADEDLPAAPDAVEVAAPAPPAEENVVVAQDAEAAPMDEVQHEEIAAEAMDAQVEGVADLVENPPDAEPALVVDTDELVTQPSVAMEAEGSTQTPQPSFTEPARNWRAELDEVRRALQNDIMPRTFSLLDGQPGLVFDVKGAFIRLYKVDGEDVLTSVIEFDSIASEETIATRGRLLALILNDAAFPVSKVEAAHAAKVLSIVVAVLRRLPSADSLSSTTLPKWLSAYLLVAEALFLMGDAMSTVSLPQPEEDVPEVPLYSGSRYMEERTFVFDTCMRTLACKELPPSEMLAILRVLALLTREPLMATSFADQAGASLLLDYFKTSSNDALAYRAPAIIIIRHIIEDQATVRYVMEQHLKRIFATAKGRPIDIPNLLRNTTPLSLRDAKSYLSVLQSTCRLTSVRPASTGYTLLLSPVASASPTTAIDANAGSAVEDVMQVDDARKPAPSSSQAEVLVHYVVGEILRVTKPPATAASTTVTSNASQPSAMRVDSTTEILKEVGVARMGNEEAEDHLYACVLMQTLTELLASYDSCKAAFTAFHRKRSTPSTKDTTSKHRANFLAFLLNEIMSPSAGISAEKMHRKGTFNGLANSVIASLCSDVITPQGVREPSDELTAARKFVLDAVAKAMKDVPSTDPPDLRYAKLHTLAELCTRLLTYRTATATTPNGVKEETSVHVAKIMLEKNFVSILTGALAEADLNHPSMKSLVGIIMRPLEQLSKIAIKMGKTSTKTKGTSVDAMDTESDGSDDEGSEGSQREETPDLYRNSALGMYGGDMEDVDFGENEDEDMDDDEDEDDEGEMEYGEDDSSDTEQSSGVEDEEGRDIEGLDVDMAGSGDDGWGERAEDVDGSEDDGSEDDGEGAVEEMMWPGAPDQPVHGEEDLEGDPNEDDDGADDGASLPRYLDISLISAPADDGPDEDQGDEEAGSIEDEFVLEVADVGVNVDDGGWGQIADPWAGITVHDVNGHRLAVPHARRNRVPQPPTYAGYAARPAAPLGDPPSHPLLAEPMDNQSSGSPPASNNRSSQRRSATAGLLGGTGTFAELIQTITNLVGGEGAQILHQLIAHGHAPSSEALQMELGGEAGAILSMIERSLSGVHHDAHRRLQNLRNERRTPPKNVDVAQFTQQSTLQRWAEEVKSVNPALVADHLTKFTNHVAIALLPAARDAHREAARLAKEELARSEAEAERRREEELKAEEEKKAEEAKQEEERRVREEEESRQAAAREAEREAELVAARIAAAASGTDVVMEESSRSTDQPAPDNAPSVAQENADAEPGTSNAPPVVPARVTVLIHGNPVDITDTGIDPSFLEALPDFMREELINQHLRESRTTAQAEIPPESTISPEFLDALPEDIRAEILHQEAADRARRDRIQAAARAPQTGPTGPSDIDAASVLATLDPQLRQAILMEQEEGFLQTLPSGMLAEANVDPRTVVRPRVIHNPPPVASLPVPRKPPPPRDAVQLLDKNGVSVLVRLLFTPHTHKRSSVHKVLVNLCENTKTRTDLLNLLLNILQTGTADLSAVDKSFSQMSVRPGKTQAPKSTPRKGGIDNNLPFIHPATEAIPNLIAQRCLEALASLVNANEQCSLFFLSEHELPAGLKRPTSKKGKGKEKVVPQTHYPIVLLLGLLDKPAILKAPSLMDLVAGLLSSITKPIVTLKDEATQAETQTAATSSAVDPGAVTTSATSSAALTDAAGTIGVPAGTDGDDTRTGRDPQKPFVTQPQIPHSVLRLVVNILTVGECSARTFQQTLSLIQHLSHLPDARDTIASELRSKAQELGHSIYADLDQLVVSLSSTSSSDSVPNVIVAKFSPPSSDQAKLLRVLKTIDYMYTSRLPTAIPGPSVGGDTTETVPSDQEKAQAIYQAFRFNPLWNRLGDCLRRVAEMSDMDHVATVLLPLIESLMVVCKYVTGATLQQRAVRETMSPRSPTTPRESTEDLFVSFTDAHRKILNSMVRNNPSLMSGSFSLLVSNPRVLDFDNKRNYFTQKLRRRPANREQYGTIQVNVRRQRVFEDSYQHLQRQTGDAFKYGKLSVRFYEEEGVDAGGVTREWFQILARQMFNPDYALFQPCAADKLTYQPNQASWVNSEHLAFFKFVGRIIGKAIFDGRLLDAYFARSLYRQMLGKPVDYRDVEWVDPEYYKSLVWILDNDPTILDLTFSVEDNAFGLTKSVPLKEGGQSIAVTNENKKEFVQLSAEYRLVKSIKDQIEAFLSGFYEIIPKDLIAIFNEQELELLISGTPDIDVDEWRAATDYTGYTSADSCIVWWWRALKSFSRDERAKVLSFATGTSKVPLGGFTELQVCHHHSPSLLWGCTDWCPTSSQGVQGVQRFAIHKAYGELDRLPSAHTCE
ncbi:hypothetical protein FRB94_005396 [Tulasnella sp. JGI-2019a]|nr:hypothetical protein FRB94_005396 [Tulasnella sp. JGI-2019a]